MKIALISNPCYENDFEKNVLISEGLIADSLEKSIDLFLFGETNLTGLEEKIKSERKYYSLDSVSKRVNAITKKYNISVCMGFTEQIDRRFFINHFISSKGNLVGFQRKLFPGNPLLQKVYSSGKKVVMIPFMNKTICILACADWLLPEPVFQTLMFEPDLVICPTDGYLWSGENLSVLPVLAKSMSLNLNAPCVISFKSTYSNNENHRKLFSGLAYDCNGNELMKKAKESNETRVEILNIDLNQKQKKWGGSKFRFDYLNQ